MAESKNTVMTNNWLNFLTQQGATIHNGLATSFGETPDDYPELKTALTDLADLGILALEGPDTLRFLQGQSTSDNNLLDDKTTLPGAICNPKGRMLSSYQAIKPVEDTVLLIMNHSLVDTSINDFDKYAAFFKTTLINKSNDYRLLGISGPNCNSSLEQHFDTVPKDINQLSIENNALLLRLSKQQFLLIVKTELAEKFWKKLSTDFKPVGIDYWHLQSIRAGLAQVELETREQFVPQMFNFQLTGAVNFKKGCYTGQEIVARMQYLGKLKRRAYRLIIKNQKPPKKSSEIQSCHDNKKVGSVLLAAPANDKDSEILAVLHESQIHATSLIIDGNTVKVSLAELPYSFDTL